jgi:Williams-Beuren syndrome DDT (WSD), D-TOX E motif
MQQLLFCEGAAAATKTEPDIRKGRWMLYRKADSVKKLMAWLHSNGERERILKARLKQVLLMFSAPPLGYGLRLFGVKVSLPQNEIFTCGFHSGACRHACKPG